ncbi:MAG TPA: hypothetical protein PKY31_13200 [Spirochaetota bacterium]|nr:hypothetical protein [Spirochaetota bacterium]
MRWNAIAISLFLLFVNGITLADVISLKNGEVYLGKANVVDSNTISIESFGSTNNVRQTDLLKIEPQLQTVADIRYEVLLADDSVLKGKLKNFDDEIGLFLETTFGAITIPTRGIKRIYDVQQRDRYYGKSYLAGLTGGYYLPTGNFKSNFGNGYLASAFAETALKSVRGLSIGGDFLFMPMDYTTSSDVSYMSYALFAHASYRYLDLRSGTLPVINRLVPYAKLGAGLVYISVEDNRATAPIDVRSEANPLMLGSIGTDVLISREVSIRIETGILSIVQSKLYNAFMIGGGVVYAFTL